MGARHPCRRRPLVGQILVAVALGVPEARERPLSAEWEARTVRAEPEAVLAPVAFGLVAFDSVASDPGVPDRGAFATVDSPPEADRDKVLEDKAVPASEDNILEDSRSQQALVEPPAAGVQVTWIFSLTRGEERGLSFSLSVGV